MIPSRPIPSARAPGARAWLAPVVLLALLLACVGGIYMATPAYAGAKGKDKEKAKEEPKPAPKTEEKKTEKTDKTAAGAEGESDDNQALLAELERQKGPTFPGKDPAFLVLPRPANRTNMQEELLNEEPSKMAERCLEYLAAQQDPDGGWSDAQFASNTGVTALACMAFMADGSRPRIGKYGMNIDRGIEFLVKNVQDGSGVISGKGSNPYGPMYEHAISTLCLLYCYGDMPWYGSRVNDIISNSITKAIAKSQKLDGGWRYQISKEGHSDMSVTANVLWVLRTAKKSGFTVSKEMVKKGTEFIEKCAQPDGSFRYRFWGLEASPSLGGTGIIALCNDGRNDHRLIRVALQKITYDYRRYTINDLKARRYFVYGSFYASLATYMMGDDYFKPWYQKVAQVYASMQRKDGELYDEHGNTVYPTAMAAIVLLSPKGYLPIYER